MGIVRPGNWQHKKCAEKEHPATVHCRFQLAELHNQWPWSEMTSTNNKMNRQTPFDHLSGSYEDLLKDPIRDHFTGVQKDFFHLRKRQLILNYFHRRAVKTFELSYMDLGCGKGELLTTLRPHFLHVAGCDVSAEMMRAIQGIDTRIQAAPQRIPFPDASFDFVSAVCVHHHVPVEERLGLCREVVRVLKPGGTYVVIEHNPLNPITRLIVSRTPVDADAVLLFPAETRRLLRDADMVVTEQEYFLFFPARVYRKIAICERLLRRFPLGGQYAVFGTKHGPGGSA